MGTWGPGLYSNDIAKDLKSTIAAVASLPFAPARLVEIVAEAFPQAASDQQNEDYTTFWLVLADQFHQRGIDGQEVFDRAIEIVNSGVDLRMAQSLELGKADFRKREKQLEALRAKLVQPAPQKPRKTIKKPQPLLMAQGDVIVFPIVKEGACFNPYVAKANWEQADWGAAVIIACGHVFDFLSYYCPIVVGRRLNTVEKPTLESLKLPRQWRLERPGTCSKTHYERMKLDNIGRIAIDSKRLREKFLNIRDGKYAAVNDISLSNSLYVPDGPRYQEQTTIESLDDIA